MKYLPKTYLKILSSQSFCSGTERHKINLQAAAFNGSDFESKIKYKSCTKFFIKNCKLKQKLWYFSKIFIAMIQFG